MDQILQGMDKVHCRIDDNLIRTEPHEHLQVLDEVLIRLEKHGILAKRSKCEFMVPSVEFLLYRVDGEGRHPTDEKIAVVKRGPRALRMWQSLVRIWDCSITIEILYPIYPRCCSRRVICSGKE